MTISTTKTPSQVIYGNPPNSANQPVPSDVVEILDDVLANGAGAADLSAIDTRVSSLEAAGVTGAEYTAGGPVACATTANITLSGEQTLDGVTTSADRVLVKDQTDTEDNGIYVSAAGAWARAGDMDAAAEVSGTAVRVDGGTANGGRVFVTYSAVTTLGTDAIVWRDGGDFSGLQDQIDTKAPLASPALTGTPTAPTAAVGTDSTQVASTAYVRGEIIDTAAGLVDYSGAGPVWPLAVDSTGQALIWYDATADRVDFATDAVTRAPLEALPGAVADGSKVFFFAYGQSLSTGTDGDPALSTTQPYSNVMFNGGSLPGTTDGTAESTLSLYNSFSALVEATDETVVAGMCNYARTRAAIERGEDPDAVAILGASLGKGGSPIVGLSKGTTHYDDVLVAAAFTRMFAIDSAYKVTAFGWLQGEGDQTNLETKAYYKPLLATLQSDIESDVQAINGQTEPVYCLTYQTNKSTLIQSDIPMAQLELAQESDRFFLVSPIYFLTFNGGLHLDNVGYKWLGGYFGRSFDALYSGHQPQWLNPVSATMRGAQVKVKFDVPVLPLRFDQTNIALATDYGFAVEDTTGVLTISAIRIERDTVVIDLSTTPNGATEVRYGLDYTGAGMAISTHNGGSGNLRDSAPEVIAINGTDYPLFNWCPHVALTCHAISE